MKFSEDIQEALGEWSDLDKIWVAKSLPETDAKLWKKHLHSVWGPSSRLGSVLKHALRKRPLYGDLAARLINLEEETTYSARDVDVLGQNRVGRELSEGYSRWFEEIGAAATADEREGLEARDRGPEALANLIAFDATINHWVPKRRWEHSRTVGLAGGSPEVDAASWSNHIIWDQYREQVTWRYGGGALEGRKVDWEHECSKRSKDRIIFPNTAELLANLFELAKSAYEPLEVFLSRILANWASRTEDAPENLLAWPKHTEALSYSSHVRVARPPSRKAEFESPSVVIGERAKQKIGSLKKHLAATQPFETSTNDTLRLLCFSLICESRLNYEQALDPSTGWLRLVDD